MCKTLDKYRHQNRLGAEKNLRVLFSKKNSSRWLCGKRWNYKLYRWGLPYIILFITFVLLHFNNRDYFKNLFSWLRQKIIFVFVPLPSLLSPFWNKPTMRSWILNTILWFCYLGVSTLRQKNESEGECNCNHLIAHVPWV